MPTSWPAITVGAEVVHVCEAHGTKGDVWEVTRQGEGGPRGGWWAHLQQQGRSRAELIPCQVLGAQHSQSVFCLLSIAKPAATGSVEVWVGV